MAKEIFEKGEGVTPSEKRLVKLAEKSFLDLWSYPNIYRNTGINGKNAGKELCDLLVVCGDYIIIFSDKTKGWKNTPDEKSDWTRWYKAAIKASMKQIIGAIRSIDQFPDKLYLDSKCNNPLPLLLPESKERKIINIIIANGSEEANRRILGEGAGSFMLIPRIKGDEHFQDAKGSNIPFAIGDINPDGPFMHVLDEVSLLTVMEELDTVTDLVTYLEKREKFIRSGQLLTAFGEEELLAYYLSNINTDQEPDFTSPNGNEWQEDTRVIIDEGLYAAFKASEQYKGKIIANEVSYIWDKIIEHFTKIFKEGTYFTFPDKTTSIQQIELALRQMVLECRFKRRILGSAFLDTLKRGSNSDKFRRLMLSHEKKEKEMAYIFLTIKYPLDFKIEGGYEQYRNARLNILYANCLAVLREMPELKRIIGIVSEPLVNKNNSGSIDLIYLEQPEWTTELLDELKRYVDIYNVKPMTGMEVKKLSAEEYFTKSNALLSPK